MELPISEKLSRYMRKPYAQPLAFVENLHVNLLSLSGTGGTGFAEGFIEDKELWPGL